MITAPTKSDQFQGSLLGLAVGDAWGRHFEGLPTEWMLDRFPDTATLLRALPETPWYYTDDTQMAIGVAEALLQDGRIVEESLCKAFADNFVPSRGYGSGARVVLTAMQEGQDYQHWTRELFPGGSFGNGAAMRVAPVGLVFHDDLDRLWEEARLQSLPTHLHPLGIEGAQVVALAVGFVVSNSTFSRQDLLAELKRRCVTTEFQHLIDVAGTVESRDDLLKLGNGIAAQESAMTAVACFLLWPDDYSQVIGNAMLIGGDTDTIAAMAGSISGAHLGVKAIAQSYLSAVEDNVKGISYIRDLAVKLSNITPSRAEPS